MEWINKLVRRFKAWQIRKHLRKEMPEVINAKPLYVVATHGGNLICIPYSEQGLHDVARKLGIPRSRYRGTHYDIPVKMMKYVYKNVDAVCTSAQAVMIAEGKIKLKEEVITIKQSEVL
jgi:hypothetical protein